MTGRSLPSPDWARRDLATPRSLDAADRKTAIGDTNRRGWNALWPELVILAIGCLAFFLRVDAEGHLRTLGGRPWEFGCLTRAVWGIPCPTCGITRALVYLMHGQWSAAWSIHPVGSLAYGQLFVYSLVRLSQHGLTHLRHTQSPLRHRSRLLGPWFVIFATLGIIQWIYRLATDSLQ